MYFISAAVILLASLALIIDCLFVYLFKWQPYWQCCSHIRSLSSQHLCLSLKVTQCNSTNGLFLVAVLYCIFNISHIHVTRMCLLNVVTLNRCWNNAEIVAGLSPWQALYVLQIWTSYLFIFHIIANGRLRLKCDGTHAETRFRLSAKRTSPFKSAGGVSSVYYWQPRCAHQR